MKICSTGKMSKKAKLHYLLKVPDVSANQQ